VAGVGTRAGSVDDGTSLLDVDDEAKQHHFQFLRRWGISSTTAPASI
jgi:hypothetical protein